MHLIFAVNVPSILEETLTHSIFQEEFSAVQDKPVVLKHLKQQVTASIFPPDGLITDMILEKYNILL